MAPINILKNVTKEMLMANPLKPLDELKMNADTCMKSRMELNTVYFQGLVCKKIEELESSKKFVVDRCMIKEGVGDIACCLQGGKVVEKAGIHAAAFSGHLPPMAVQQMKSKLKDLCIDGLQFFATGVSGVTHFVNPHIPTMHFNYRYFEVEDVNKKRCSWFGGGQDLTPNYIDEEDAEHFHRVLKEACDKHNEEYYPKYKKWCDDYFWNAFRGEARGIGGIFFDDLEEPDLESCFEFAFSCCEAIMPAYIPIVEKHLHDKYTEQEKYWQQIRRGRYVEFNLAIDRGTKFGLFTPGIRVESVLMSMPSKASWEYMHEPKEGSNEQRLLQVLKKPRDWV